MSFLWIIIGLTVGFLFINQIELANRNILLMIIIIAITALIPLYRKSYIEQKRDK